MAIWRPQYKERIGGVGGARPLREVFSFESPRLDGYGQDIYIYPVWAIKKSKNHFGPLTRKFSKILEQRLSILKIFKNLKLKIL